MTDARLLTDYTNTGSAVAFAQIVRRHIGLVYAAAARQVHDHHLAEEITQSVFVLLARKAAYFSEDTCLAGWLLKATRYAAMDAIKIRNRRRNHESRAAEMNTARRVSDPSGVAEQCELLDLLDDGLHGLSRLDRQAVLLRFYQQKPFDEIGRGLGVDADAARKRVSRAVERLREYFLQRVGAAATTTAVIAMLSAEFRAAAPGHLLSRVTVNALLIQPDTRAESINRRMIREGVARWSIGITATLCVCALCFASVRSILVQNWPSSSSLVHQVDDHGPQ